MSTDDDIKQEEHRRLGIAGRCGGSCHGANPASPKPHSCPYKSDVDDDRETLCICCEDCQQTCADDI